MGVSFLSPLLLGGAALVAVPIVLHLIMRRKPVPHEFPALRFLRERASATRRRLRLSHILLLLLRVAAIALLATALARPVLRGAGWLGDREGPVAAAFVFDTAPRMMLREANRTRLDQAKAMAKVLFGKLPAASKVAVLDTSGGAAAFSPTDAAAAVRIEKLTAATPAVPLSAAIVDGLRLLEGAGLERRELYVFTDCSRGAWENAAPLDLAASHPGTAVLFVDVAAAAPQNFALEGIALSSDQLPAGTPLAITASTGRSGPEATRAVAVEVLAADGHYVRRAVKPLVWKPGVADQVDFEVAGLEPGLRQGRVIVEGSDDLEADDVRSFTVEVGAPARVIVAAPAPAARTGLFMMQAVAPLALRKAGKARFDATLVDVATLDTVSWDAARGIVLVDPPPLPPRTWEMLEQWIAAGRGLVVWLGPRAGDPARFNSAASARAQPGWGKLPRAGGPRPSDPGGVPSGRRRGAVAGLSRVASLGVRGTGAAARRGAWRGGRRGDRCGRIPQRPAGRVRASRRPGRRDRGHHAGLAGRRRPRCLEHAGHGIRALAVRDARQRDAAARDRHGRRPKRGHGHAGCAAR
jgi:hypothetical protein